MGYITEVAGVTFSDSDSAPVSKFLNPGPAIFQIWESDSCSDSGYNHQSNLNLPMFLLKNWPHRLLLLLKLKSYSGSGFSQIFDSGSGSKKKRRILPDSTPDPVPPLLHTSCFKRSDMKSPKFVVSSWSFLFQFGLNLGWIKSAHSLICIEKR